MNKKVKIKKRPIMRLTPRGWVPTGEMELYAEHEDGRIIFEGKGTVKLDGMEIGDADVTLRRKRETP